MSTLWNWINHNGRYLQRVGLLEDGTLYNPNGYDEAVVREAIRFATARQHARRSVAAKRAAVTRQRRQEKLVYEVAKGILAEEKYGPREHCVICGKGLTDDESITRGIGSDCWQRVLEAISATKERHHLEAIQ